MGTMQALPGIYSAAQKSGSPAASPTGWNTEALGSDLLPSYSHLNQAGVVYSTGMQMTSISNATFTATTGLSATIGTAATGTPIIGIYNPPSSGVNAHVIKACLQVTITALQATGPGSFIWAGFPANNLITVASQAIPISRKTFLPKGSVCFGLSGLALTGLSNLGNFLGASGVGGGAMLNLSNLQTAVGLDTAPAPAFEIVNGDIIVAPGCVLALFCTTTPVAHSAAGSVVWAELPA